MDIDDQDRLAKDYLLHRLSDADRLSWEQRFFDDSDLFEQVEIAEDELIDAYLGGQLSTEERSAFVRHLLASPRVAQRVEFAAMIARASSRQLTSTKTKARREKIHPVPGSTLKSWKSLIWPATAEARFAFVTLCLFVLLGTATMIYVGLWVRSESRRLFAEREAISRQSQELLARNSKYSEEMTRLAAELQEQKAANERLNAELEKQSERPLQPRPVLSLVLFGGASRSASGLSTLKLPESQATVELRLVLEADDDYSDYSVFITTVDGREIVHRDGIKSQRTSQGKLLAVRFSSTRFVTDDYIVKVSGVANSRIEPLRDYTFRVVRNRP